MLSWIESTGLARSVAGSLQVTAMLSAVHLVGLALLVGGAVVSGLRLLGVALRAVPVAEVYRSTARGMVIGGAISVVSGLLLVSPRASAAAGNEFFRLKMGLLVAAVLFHGVVLRRVAVPGEGPARVLSGALGLSLWLGVVVAGSAYILLE